MHKNERSFLTKTASTPNGALILGYTDAGEPCYMTARERSWHMAVFGATGTGKTTEMSGFIRQDIDAYRRVGVLCPHGDLFYRTLDYCCYRRAFGPQPETVLFNPSDGEWVTPYNPFLPRCGDLSVQVDRRVQATLRAWGQHGSDETPRLEKWLKCIFTVLIECKLTILEARYLIDQHAPEIRAYLTRGLSDPLVRTKLEQLAAYKPSDFYGQIESVENRLMRFLCSDVVRRTMGLGTSAIDPEAIMEGGQNFLANLAPGPFQSREQARLWGTLWVTEFVEAASRRPTGSRPFYLYIDEAELFVIPEIGEALDQCRKKGLHLTLAFQHLGQLKAEDLKVYKSVKNVRNKIVFAVPDRIDATELADDLFDGLAEPEVKYVRRHLTHRIYDTRETSITRGDSSSQTAGSTHSITDTAGHSTTESEGTARTSGNARQNSRSSSESGSQGESWQDGWSHANAEAWQRPRWYIGLPAVIGTKTSTRTSGRSYNRSATTQSSFSAAEQESSSSHEDTAESRQSSIAESQSRATGTAKSIQTGTTHTVSITDQPGTRHVPFFVEQPEHYTLEERRWRAAEVIMRQPTGHCVALVGGKRAQRLTVRAPKPFFLGPRYLLGAVQRLYKKHALPRKEAERLLAAREAKLLAEAQPAAQSRPPAAKKSPTKGRAEGTPSLFDDILGKE